MAKRILIIGGGPGGYVAALRAAKLGAQVMLVEEDALGGTCLNRGCIPTKTFLHTVELYKEVAGHGPELGLSCPSIAVDWPGLMRRKKKVVDRLVAGVQALLKSAGVQVIDGRASLVGPREALVRLTDGKTEKIPANEVILATGSIPAVPPAEGFDLPGVVTSNEALSFEKPPKSLLIIGGGVIGIELASVFAPLGTEITVVEMLPEILPNVDEELVALMRASLQASGVDIHTGVMVEKVEQAAGSLKVSIGGSKPFSKTVEKVLVATGRKPNTAGLGLEELGVYMEKGRIKVDGRMATNLPGLWAIGDCASPIMLAHVASREGEVAVDNIMGRHAKIDYHTVPGAIYTSPEIAWVGLTESAALKSGLKIKVAKLPMAYNGKSLVMNSQDGLCKIITEEKYGQILGVHLMAPRATDIIGEAAMAITLEATLADMTAVIHAHPTVNEILGETAASGLILS